MAQNLNESHGYNTQALTAQSYLYKFQKHISVRNKNSKLITVHILGD